MIGLLGDVEVVDIDGGHNAMMSRPAEVARLVNTIARPYLAARGGPAHDEYA